MTRHDRIVANLTRNGAMPTVLTICRRHKLSLASLTGQRRHPATVRARHEAWSVVHGTLGLSYPETAAVFEVLSHQSVLVAIRKRLRRMGYAG